LLPEIAFSPIVAAEEPVAVEAGAVGANAVEVSPVETSSVEVSSDAVALIETPAMDAPPDQPATETTAETVAAADAPAPDAAVDAAAAPDADAVPEMVEVWRPGGRSEERRPRHDRSRHRPQDRPQEGAAAAAPGEAADGAKRERHGRGRRDRSNDFRKLRANAPAEAATPAADGAPAAERAPVVREPREDKGRPPRERFQGKGRDNDKGKFGGGRDKGGRDKGGRDKRPDGGPSHRQFATTAPPRERDRPIDPNSPFAKLAALREQLTANRKDQR
jgi:ATP-dependent RNA helicase SUPV3L1/SUV3